MSRPRVIGKSELVRRVSATCQLTPTECGAVFDALIDVVADALLDRKIVNLHGLGRFKLKDYEAMTKKCSLTGKTITVPARARAVYRPAKSLRNI